MFLKLCPKKIIQQFLNVFSHLLANGLLGFRDAKFVVTDSFHGTVFSIIFQKPFIVIGNQMRGLSRMSSLLTIFGLKKRLISTESELKESLFENIDYEKVNNIKIQWKNKSLGFLKNNLN